MKKFYWVFALLLAALTFSCVLGTGGSENGSIGMNFALNPGEKALDAAVNRVRVWVYANNVLIVNKTAGTDYYGSDLIAGEGAVTISELPPGENYRIVVAAGELDTDTDPAVWTTTNFGTSPLFTIAAGVETALELELIPITVNKDLGRNYKSTVATGGTIYAATADKVYTASAVDSGTMTENGVTYSGTINSLNIGSPFTSPFLLVNTTTNILNESGSSLALFSSVPEGGILQSGSFGGAVDGVYFYQSEKEFGAKTGLDANWTQIPIDIDGLSGKPVSDFFVTEATSGGSVFGFFATRFVGSFRMAESFISDNSGETGDYFVQQILGKNDKLNFFGADLPLIQSFGYTGLSNGHTLFVGTKNGLYQTEAGFGDDAFAEKPTLVAGTKGLDIRRVVTYVSGTETLVGCRSDKDIVVIKIKSNVPYVYRLPFLAYSLGDLNGIAWNGTKLVVAGSKGIAEVDTSTF